MPAAIVVERRIRLDRQPTPRLIVGREHREQQTCGQRTHLGVELPRQVSFVELRVRSKELGGEWEPALGLELEHIHADDRVSRRSRCAALDRVAEFGFCARVVEEARRGGFRHHLQRSDCRAGFREVRCVRNVHCQSSCIRLRRGGEEVVDGVADAGVEQPSQRVSKRVDEHRVLGKVDGEHRT